MQNEDSHLESDHEDRFLIEDLDDDWDEEDDSWYSDSPDERDASDNRYDYGF